MSDINCIDCQKRKMGGCEKHPTKICSIPNCDKKCGYSIHGVLKRKNLILPRINFLTSPKKDIKDGLLIWWEPTKETGTKVSVSDIKKGEREYELPNDLGLIKGIYMKIR